MKWYIGNEICYIYYLLDQSFCYKCRGHYYTIGKEAEIVRITNCMFMTRFSFGSLRFDWNMSEDELLSPVRANYNKLRPVEVYYSFVLQNLLIGHSLVQSYSCNSVISHDLSAIKIIFWASPIMSRCKFCLWLKGFWQIQFIHQMRLKLNICSLSSFSK